MRGCGSGNWPPTFTLGQRQAIKKIALSRPVDHDLPFSTWSLSKLAEFLVADGVVDDISHEGRVAYIDFRDLSEAAALLLRDPALHGETYDLYGSDAYTFPEIAQLLSRILGHEVTYVPVSPDDRRSALLGNGVSAWFAELRLSLETSAEAGQIGTVTTTLTELLGHDPRTVEEFLIENAARFRS